MFHFSFRNQSLFLRKNTDIKLKNGWKLSFWGSFWFEIYCHGVKSQKMPKKVSLHSKKNKIRNVRQMNLVKDHKWWLFLLDAFYWKTTSQINTFHHLFHLSRRNLLVHSLFRCKTNNTNQKAKKSCVACAVFCDGAHLQCVTITIFVNTLRVLRKRPWSLLVCPGTTIARWPIHERWVSFSLTLKKQMDKQIA